MSNNHSLVKANNALTETISNNIPDYRDANPIFSTPGKG
jgi:hypothetical protein